MLARKIRHLTRKQPGVVNGARWHLIGTNDTMCERNSVIVFSERRSLVDDTRTAFLGHVCVVKNSEGFILILSAIGSGVNDTLHLAAEQDTPVR